MARAKKKFSRKEMKKPDEFLKKSWEFSDWAGKHSRQIIIITVVIIVLILAGAIIWSSMESRQIKSSKQMDDVFEVISKNIAPTEYVEGMKPSGDDDTFGSKFHKDEALLKEYIGVREKAKTDAVKKTALLGMARAYLGLGKYEEAKKAFDSLAKDPSGMDGMLHFIYEGFGFTYEGLGKMDEAVNQFKRLEKCEDGSYRELALYHQARISESQGKKDEAGKLYKQISDAINSAQEMSPLLAYLQEKISGKEGVEFAPAVFKPPGSGPGMGPGMGPGGELTPEKLEELKEKLEEFKKMQDEEARAKEKADEEALKAAGEKEGSEAGEAPGKKAEKKAGGEAEKEEGEKGKKAGKEKAVEKEGAEKEAPPKDEVEGNQ